MELRGVHSYDCERRRGGAHSDGGLHHLQHVDDIADLPGRCVLGLGRCPPRPAVRLSQRVTIPSSSCWCPIPDGVLFALEGGLAGLDAQALRARMGSPTLPR